MDLPDDIDWPDRTRDWWDAWVGADITKSWTPLMWQYLLDTALIHREIWATGNVARMGELRARVERLGAVGGAPAAAATPPAPAAKVVTPLDDLANRRAQRSAGA